ncbi:glycosyltransferase family 2 protein [Roseicitreum antarcticum]|uniref:Glycosyltransferase involved in cell wall bisynthesis n=1 Tax=Roseicitreum antarcticum TaxID=564137 RepID=A0A1H2RT97_9RHOB|nr:glycosyltransferase [Roseicitreum antarcticum]SDW22400.1 Glycosyltransferase involved in cell wall bisynthesis [Roseicitreum antarcticum]
MLTVIIPANNEAQYIGPCLSAVLASDAPEAMGVAVIVAANGCSDATVQIAGTFADRFKSRGWNLSVLDIARGNKIGALNAADTATATGSALIYLDADVIVSPPLLAQMAAVLRTDAPVYAGGTPLVTPPESRLTTAYARLWLRLPFHDSGAPGFGLFGVNVAGRARWGAFPDLISDDTFVRLQFRPEERVQVPATYRWPMVEGFRRLVRVRRRQDIGVAEIATRYPELLANEGKAPTPRFWPLFRADPVGFAVYTSVAVMVRISRLWAGNEWVRGR